MDRGWLQLGHTEIANTTRCIAYMRRGVRNGTVDIVTDESWPDLPRWLGKPEPYRSPWEDDDCPWYDPDNPNSAEFAGVWVMGVEGAEGTPVDREIVEGAVEGGAFGATRTPPREMTFEALVIGGTPSGLTFGIEWLGSVLRGDPCEPDDGQGRNLLFLESQPPSDPRMTEEEVMAVANGESRMLSRVALTEPLRIEERVGQWTAQGYGATIARVSFTLTAAVPYVWQMPAPLVSGLRPVDGVEQTVRFENVDEDGNCPTDCVDTDGGVLWDPDLPPLAVLPRPITPEAAAGCAPMESLRLTWRLGEGRIPSLGQTVPTVTVRTGPLDERNLRVQWAEGEPDTERELSCATLGEALIAYIPRRSTLTLDAVTGLATCLTADGRVLDATGMVTGKFGGPWSPPVLRCGRPYTLIVDAPRRVDLETTVDVIATTRRA